MKIIMRYCLILCCVVLGSDFLMGGKGKKPTQWVKANEFIQSPKTNLKPSQTRMNATKDFPDLSIVWWARGDIKEVPAPIAGSTSVIVFHVDQTKNFKDKQVFLFELAAVRHTLSPWVKKGEVAGGHFAKYLKMYSNTGESCDGYFFNMEDVTFVGTRVEPSSLYKQHPLCKIILWSRKLSHINNWKPEALKAAFDERISLSYVLNVIVNSDFTKTSEKDGSTSFVVDGFDVLPCFKISVNRDGDKNVYRIKSIYPWANNFEFITDNMPVYFDRQFMGPNHSVLEKIKTIF